MASGETTSNTFLTLTRTETRPQQRLLEEIRGGAKTLHGIAHRASIDPTTAAQLLTQMMTSGWFRLITTNAGEHFLVPAEPGDQLIDPDLYSGIIGALYAGATTTTDIAEHLGLPHTAAIDLAVAITIRIAATWHTPPQDPPCPT